MQARTFLHSQVSLQTSLSEEVSGQLDGASKTSAHHSGANTTVQPTHALRLVYLTQSIKCVAVFVLCSDGEEWGVRLEASLDQEEGRSESGTDDTRCGSSEDVNTQRLNLGIFIDGRRSAMAQRFVEP